MACRSCCECCRLVHPPLPEPKETLARRSRGRSRSCRLLWQHKESQTTATKSQVCRGPTWDEARACLCGLLPLADRLGPALHVNHRKVNLCAKLPNEPGGTAAQPPGRPREHINLQAQGLRELSPSSWKALSSGESPSKPRARSGLSMHRMLGRWPRPARRLSVVSTTTAAGPRPRPSAAWLCP